MVSAEDRRVHPVSFVANGPVLREGKAVQQGAKVAVSTRCRTEWRKVIRTRVSLRADEEEIRYYCMRPVFDSSSSTLRRDCHTMGPPRG
mmetsp:Transcript_43576/g.170564  ORF Transcript_43576/g.170564 Transcript_43576/m.170564 type:complete len:89 (-) Transcript_43576:109-375(-)